MHIISFQFPKWNHQQVVMNPLTNHIIQSLTKIIQYWLYLILFSFPLLRGISDSLFLIVPHCSSLSIIRLLFFSLVLCSMDLCSCYSINSWCFRLSPGWSSFGSIDPSLGHMVFTGVVQYMFPEQTNEWKNACLTKQHIS
jgi:hypothetical protein